MIGLVFVGLMLSSLVSVSAYFYPDVRGVTQQVIDAYVDVGEPVLQALFGGYGGWSGWLLFERFLLFILLLALIFVILGRVEFFEKQKAVRWVVAIIVPLIAIRFMDYDWLTTILTQYKLVAVIISSILPFIIFFYFVHSIGKDYPMLRKISWIFFIGVYTGLWNTAETDFSGALFFWTVVGAVLALIFDRRIEAWMMAKQIARGDRWRVDQEIARINGEIQHLHRDRGLFPDPREVDRQIKELEMQRRYITRQR